MQLAEDNIISSLPVSVLIAPKQGISVIHVSIDHIEPELKPGAAWEPRQYFFFFLKQYHAATIPSAVCLAETEGSEPFLAGF